MIMKLFSVKLTTKSLLLYGKKVVFVYNRLLLVITLPKNEFNKIAKRGCLEIYSFGQKITL